MKLSDVQQVTFDELDVMDADAVVVASGYESRAVHVPGRLQADCARRKYALGFTDRISLARRSNDLTLERLGYELRTADGGSDTAVKTLLTEIFQSPRQHMSLVVDYSCMTRAWYAAILRFISNLVGGAARVDVLFLYSIARFVVPESTALNKYMGPIPGYCRLDLPDEAALILGLGCDGERALGLAEYVEAAQTYAFCPDPAPDHRLVDAVLHNNRRLIQRLGPDRVLRYPFDDLSTTDMVLTSLCSGLSKGYRVTMAPLGPKPFSLLCLLLATRFPMYDVWRVSAGEKARAIDRKAQGEVVACRATFVADGEQSPSPTEPGMPLARR